MAQIGPVPSFEATRSAVRERKQPVGLSGPSPNKPARVSTPFSRETLAFQKKTRTTSKRAIEIAKGRYAELMRGRK